MAYLEYDKSTGLVVVIHETEVEPAEGRGVVELEIYKPGDEFEWSIYINENERGEYSSHSAVRNNPYATRLLRENEELKAENALLAFELAQTQVRLDQAEQEQATLLLTLVQEGVI
mgnify:CR=1 FL=1|jgi:hypothetical protein